MNWYIGRRIVLERPHNSGFYIIRELHGQGEVAVQTDWDYPGTASAFGWSPSQAYGEWIDPAIPLTADGKDNYCQHANTDGTVACACGCQPRHFIESAQDYLDEHVGDVADDPGYFSEEGGAQ